MPKKCKVNPDACIGCGLCAASHPEAFELDDEGKAKCIGGDDEALDDAVANCPVGAIEEE